MLALEIWVEEHLEEEKNDALVDEELRQQLWLNSLGAVHLLLNHGLDYHHKLRVKLYHAEDLILK